MELVDREKACQEILATRKYIEGPPENAQDNWILQYLKERLHKNMNESYEIWKEVFKSKHGEDSNGWRGEFMSRWDRLDCLPISSVKNKKIYQREIDLINSCQLKTIWQKQILLVAICYFKFSGEKAISDFPIGSFGKYVKDAPSYITENMAWEILQEAIRVGLFKCLEKKQWDYMNGGYYGLKVYEFQDRKYADDIVSFEIWNAYDVSKYSGWFDTTLICQKCGKRFVGNCRTKRFICKDCWEHSRRESAKQRMNRNRKCSHEC